ncbi:MAG: YncE family protein [Janthinobacterium lividum]
MPQCLQEWRSGRRSPLSCYTMPMTFGKLLPSLCLVIASPIAAQKPEGRAITPFAVLADSANHVFYAVDTPNNRIFAVDANTGTAIPITVGTRPIAMALDAGSHRVYVVNAGSGDVSVVDTVSRKVVGQPKTDLHPYAIAVDPELHRVYVSNTFSNKLTVIDGTTNASRQLPLGSKDALLCDPIRHQLYMLGYEDDALQVLDEVTESTTRRPATNHLWSMALDKATGDIKVVSVGNASLLTLRLNKPAQAQPVGGFPSALAIDDEVAVTTNYADASISIVRGTKVKRVTVGSHPQAIAVDAHHRAYVANTHSDSVSIVSLKAGKVIQAIPAGKNPYAIAVDLATGTFIVANYNVDGGAAYTVLRASR